MPWSTSTKTSKNSRSVLSFITVYIHLRTYLHITGVHKARGEAKRYEPAIRLQNH